MNLAKKLIKRIKIGYIEIKYSIMDFILNDKLLINYWIPPKAYLFSYNFGDDINFVLMHLISKKRVIPYKYALYSKRKKRINYLCIGSIIPQLTNKRTIIWGSGVLSPNHVLKEKPLKVLAVRGPLSREYLLRNNVDCPEIYGDPAILLPLYYHPPIKKKYKIGIIPHYKDKKSPALNEYLKHLEVTIIDIQNYNLWTSFIDKICECEFILSSSLHGIIISDAYKIPNKWICFTKNSDTFKFEDYYLSIQKIGEKPFFLTPNIPIEKLFEMKTHWISPHFDIQKILMTCPFKY